MTDFNISLRCGIGDILYTYAAIESIKHNYENIYVDVALDLITAFKNDSQPHKDFVIALVNLLYTDEKYKKFQKVAVNDIFFLFRDRNLIYTLPKCAHLLCKQSKTIINEPYIIVTTKARELNSNIYGMVKSEFINALSDVAKKYKIVIMGEKNIDDNEEYRTLGSAVVHSVYKDLITLDNTIDLTEDLFCSSDNSNPANLERMMEDCDLMNKAECVVTLGCGGNLALAVAVSKKVIGFRSDSYVESDPMFAAGRPDITVTFDFSLFIASLKSLAA